MIRREKVKADLEAQVKNYQNNFCFVQECVRSPNEKRKFEQKLRKMLCRRFCGASSFAAVSTEEGNLRIDRREQAV